MEHEIKQKLASLETQHGIKILHACESGSRAWGFESMDSDWDVRFIYMHDPEWYSAVFPEELDIESKQAINLPLDKNLIDMAGWDLRKTFGLMYNSNPVVWEWLTSPMLYRSEPGVLAMLQETAQEYYRRNACIHHYYNMANGNFMDYIMVPQAKPVPKDVVVKKYLYVIRPVLACLWRMNRESPPPMELSKLIQAEFHRIDSGARSAIEQLVMRKKAGVELGLGPPIPTLDRWLSEKLREIFEFKETMDGFPERSVTDLNNRFREVLRWVNQAKS